MGKQWVVLAMAGLLGLAMAGDALAQCGRGRGRGWCRGQAAQAVPASPAADRQGDAAAPPAAKGREQTAPVGEQMRLRLRDGSCGSCPADCPNCDQCPRLRDGSCGGCPATGGEPLRLQRRLRDGSCGACPPGSQGDGAPVQRRLRDGSCGACPLR